MRCKYRSTMNKIELDVLFHCFTTPTRQTSGSGRVAKVVFDAYIKTKKVWYFVLKLRIHYAALFSKYFDPNLRYRFLKFKNIIITLA